MKVTILTASLAISFLCSSCKSQDNYTTGITPDHKTRVAATGTEQETKPGKDLDGSHKEENLLKTLLEAMLKDGMTEKAKTRYIASIKQSPQAAFSVYGTIADHMKKHGANIELAEWSGALVQSDLPAHLKKAAAIQRNEALIAAGRFHGVLDSVSEHRDELPGEQFQQVMEKLYNRLMKDKTEKLINRLNTYCIRQLPNHIGLKELRIYIDTKKTAKENTASAAKTLTTNFGVLSDHYLSKAAKVVLQNADKQNATNIIQEITGMIYSKPADMPLTAATAATYWLKLSEQNKDASGLVKKLQTLLKADIESGRIARLLRNSAYTVLAMGDTTAVNETIMLGRELLAKIDSEDQSDRLLWMLFDMHCFIEDFDSALAILDRVKETPHQRIDVLRNKTNAHLAMKKGNWNDAITGFRKFMEEIKNMRTDQRDLVTGNIIPYQSILGLNAKRIGDLYMKQDKQDEAVAAYREAIKYYTNALSKLSAKDNQREEIRKKLDELENVIK